MAHLTPLLLVLQIAGAHHGTAVVAQSNAVAEKMNPAGTSYVDPELHPFLPEMVYQSSGSVWTRQIDLATGLFSDTESDAVYVDDASPLQIARNGPEYGWDSGGVSIFYNKTAFNNVHRIWRATALAGGSYSATPITSLGVSRINELPSQWGDGPTTWLVYARDAVQQSPAVIANTNEGNPTDDELTLTPVEPGYAGFRWLRGTSMHTVTIAEGEHAGDVLLVDASDGFQRRITNDGDIKFDPYPFYAPELSNRLCVAAIVNDVNLAIYVDFGQEFFTRISTLTPPEGTDLTFLQSPEPFVSGNRSLIALSIADNNGSFYEDVNESEIWVYGIFDGPLRYAERFDDGEPGTVRHEAEVLSGPDEIFLYYNLRKDLPNGDPGGFDIYRVLTGLRPDPNAPTAQP